MIDWNEIDWNDKTLLFTAVVSDAQNFAPNFAAFCKKNTIVTCEINGAMAQMPNPAYKDKLTGMIMAGQKEFISTVLITAIIFYREKKETKVHGNKLPN